MKKYAIFVVLFNRQTKQTKKRHTFYVYDYTMCKETNTGGKAGGRSFCFLIVAP